MGIRKIFHKFVVGFERLLEPSVPQPTEEKRYGNTGEVDFIREIKSYLPDCKIKKNVIINTLEGNAEIDCLILYKNKIFAVEIKRWKGSLYEQDGCFIQRKYEKWTGEVHNKNHKSPFKQLGRAIFLLRKKFPEYVWINPIVFFKDADFIEIDSDNVWFNNIETLVSYVVKDGKNTRYDATAFFNKCVAADYLYYDSKRQPVACIICDEFLNFKTKTGKTISRCDIKEIRINHYWSYDELKILTFSGKIYSSKREKSYVHIIDNGQKKKYSLSKLDYIKLGDVV